MSPHPAHDKLLPCPFCSDDGDKGVQEVTMMTGDRPKFNRITCQACGAMCPEHNWNRRIAPGQPEVAEPIVEGESLCANCGKSSSQAQECISDYPEEGEWFCSHDCKDLHDELGCPHEHHVGYRHPQEARRLIDCENALRSLACWLGVGGHNAPTVDAKVFEEKIRSGVDHLTPTHAAAAGKESGND